MRRFIDILVAILWLAVTAPILLLVTILIKIDSPGPAFYVPRMVGQNGKVFSLHRFRTMSVSRPSLDAPQKFTRAGTFLRNYSLDHLPMLINLLKGDLTLVGPRPMEIETVDLQDPIWQRYVQLKPGLFNYAVLKLGKLWAPSRDSHPMLNQELELKYRHQRSAIHDLQLIMQFLRAWITSSGNVKARGKPDPEVESKVRQKRSG